MTRLRDVPVDVSLAALELKVLERWRAERTFERSVAARSGRPAYVFYDGPPFATGLPHYGHILTSYIKDVVPRYFTMKGFHVPRRWGWDCHGLPVEFEVEKTLGISSRAEILKLGIGTFNDTCRSLVLRYADDWRTIIDRLGRWVDFEHAYRTMDQDYIESVLWCFKELWDRGLVYEGTKVVAYCIRCQTPLSNFEARLDDAYRPRDDPAITARFRLTDAPAESLLVWTTTPWTLPSNVAIAVGADIDYVRMERDGQSVWLADAARARYAHELDGWTEREHAPGRSFAGRRYTPLFPYFADTPRAFVVTTAEFVGVDEGTGIVHLAPAFGEDDAAVCQALGITGPNPVRDDGTFDPRVAEFAGETVFAANDAIARHLKGEGAVFRRERYTHSYPHCWRCDNPLIYRAVDTWFVRVTAFKDGMLAANARIRWIPDHVGTGRFANWLENARDWAVSRSRFWGAPVPIWRCGGCGAMEVFGSRTALEARAGRPVTELHRPAIDEVTISCTACAGTMTRVPDVLDCWFESGSMPYAQVHFPFENEGTFRATFPADFIVEYVAQTRGWFYTLVALSTALFDGPPFKNVVCHGVILGEDGRKMSKRLQNYPDPLELVGEHGSDALRIALLSSAAVSGNDIRFSGASVRDAVRRWCLPLWNGLHYFTSYARIDDFEPTGTFPAPTRLDRYLLSETESLRADLEAAMDAYDFARAYALIEAWVTSLSTWYIRLTRSRLWREGMDEDKRTACEVLYAAFDTVAKLVAPFIPFLAESVYAALGHDASVHLADWPAARPEWLAPDVAEEMRLLRSLVRLARNIRENNKVKHRQPLRLLLVSGIPAAVLDANQEFLREELNVKEIRPLASPEQYVERIVALDAQRLGRRLRERFKAVAAAARAGRVAAVDGGRLEVAGETLAPDEFSFRYQPREGGLDVAAEGDVIVLLDLATDEALVLEGYARDLNRMIQNLRKRARLDYTDRTVVSVVGGPETAAVLRAHGAWLADQALAVRLSSDVLAEPLASDDGELGSERVRLSLARAPG